MLSGRSRKWSISLILAAAVLLGTVGAEARQKFNLGYFEAGPYPVHSLLRAEFYKQLEQIIPDEYEFVTIPQGFRSANWKRDTCQIMAAELAATKQIDILIAMGPWVVHDLLAAGFSKPIIAMHQFEPALEGLVDSTGRPIAENLTVHIQPGKLLNDMMVLTTLLDVKRLGFLYFPSADERDQVIERVSQIGEKLGFEVVTAEGYDNYGTFAFFKSFNLLDKDIDAVYLPPLWGLKLANLADFLNRVSDQKIPAYTSEGKMILEKGALATNSFYSAISEARFHAFKAVRIMQGERPADLPVNFRGGPGLAVNNATAVKIGIDLPLDVLTDFYVVEAPVDEWAPYYTLNDAVNRGITRNPGYLSFADALKAAEETARQTHSQLLPHLYGSAGLRYVDDNTAHNFRELVANEQYRASINFEESLSMEAIRSIKVATQKKRQTEINLTRAQLDTEMAVSIAYLNFLQAKEILDAQVRNRSLIEHNLELARAKQLTTGGDTLDIIRLEDERYRATLDVIQAGADVGVARVIMNALFNMPGDDVFVLDSVVFSESSFFKTEGSLYKQIRSLPSQRELLSRLTGQALAANPSVRSRDIQIKIQRGLLAQSTARYYPQFGLRASLNFSDWLEDRLSFEQKHTTWTVGAFVKIPFFLGSDRIRERGKLKARLSQAEYLKDEVSLDVMQAVQTNFHRLTAAASRMTPAGKSRQRAGEALNFVIPQYSAGKATLIELLDFQSSARDAEIAAIRARYDYYQAMARLVHALGWTVHDSYSNFLEEFHRRLEG
ncbi:MAG: TolC family protein [Candidatus Zixiibacteriota bacterium]|nr:MAG: TolC family protein [candidate division Zixibacteria bacterium]